MNMERSVRLRLGLAAPVLGALYYYLLVFLIGWTSAVLQWPSWWLGVFPSRHIAAVTWLVCVHTIGVISAAIPVAAMAIAIVRERAVLLGILAAAMATTVGILPSLRSDIWPLIWNNHPIFFITDQIKLLVAVPFAAWIIRKPFSSSGFPTTALR
jgi:hypothetical protein